MAPNILSLFDCGPNKLLEGKGKIILSLCNPPLVLNACKCAEVLLKPPDRDKNYLNASSIV